MKTSLIIPAYFANQELVDMTLSCIASNKEDVQLILIADNAPYTVNVNNALRATTGDIIVIGNNDLTFPEIWLRGLVRGLGSEYDITTCWTSDQKIEHSDIPELSAKFGSLFAMTRQVYETLGDFDEQFKGYFADLDYRQRALEAGFKIAKYRDMMVEHKAKATYNVTDEEDSEYQRSKLLFEAKWGFLE